MTKALIRSFAIWARMLKNPPVRDEELVRMWEAALALHHVTADELEAATPVILGRHVFWPAPAEVIAAVAEVRAMRREVEFRRKWDGLVLTVDPDGRPALAPPGSGPALPAPAPGSGLTREQRAGILSKMTSPAARAAFLSMLQEAGNLTETEVETERALREEARRDDEARAAADEKERVERVRAQARMLRSGEAWE